MKWNQNPCNWVIPISRDTTHCGKQPFPFICRLLGAMILLASCHTRSTFEVRDNLQLDATLLATSVVADNLHVPWDLLWGPNDKLWFNEQGGTIYELTVETGEKRLLLKIPDVWVKRTAGLLGMALFDDKKSPPYLFVTYTVTIEDQIFSRLVRYTYKNKKLQNPLILWTIPAANGHNGSRIVISSDQKIFWATGDAQDANNAQDSTKLNGKILRLNIDGSIPLDNPIQNSPVYAWGFRNIQGLAISAKGALFASEHGDAMEDEMNRVWPLQNYGWPIMEGMQLGLKSKHDSLPNGMVEPLRSWTPTIAPCGLAFYNHPQIPEWTQSLLMVSLKDRSLRVLKLDPDEKKVIHEVIYFQQRYGRLRDVCVAPNGDVYISTSNRDWNPYNHPEDNDDKIIRISSVKKMAKKPLKGIQVRQGTDGAYSGKALYGIYCASCHGATGLGAPGTFPALKGSAVVNGDKATLIHLYLHGIKITSNAMQMPSFKFLSPQESVFILNYIKNSWGNQSGEVSISDFQMEAEPSPK